MGAERLGEGFQRRLPHKHPRPGSSPLKAPPQKVTLAPEETMRSVRAMGVLLCAAALGGCAETGWPAYSSPYAAYGGGYGGYVGAPLYSPPYPYYSAPSYPYHSYGYWGGNRWGDHEWHGHAAPPPAASPAPRPPAPPPPAAGAQAAHNQHLLNQLGVRPN